MLTRRWPLTVIAADAWVTTRGANASTKGASNEIAIGKRGMPTCCSLQDGFQPICDATPYGFSDDDEPSWHECY